MSTYIKKINDKYIKEFKNRVISGLRTLVRGSESMYMKVILDELNRLFRIISGRATSKKSISTRNDFPDTKKHNSLLDAIDIDIEKIYTAQGIIESDVQNLVNFNSIAREKQINNLTRAQRQVYSAYIKSKKGITGTTTIREDFKDDHLTNDSKGIEINLTKECLTLSTIAKNMNRDSIDIDYVEGIFIETPNKKFNMYPNNRILSVGSYWKRSKSDPHFSNKNDIKYYKGLMVDDPNGSNVSSTQFEAVYTYDKSNSIRVDIENEISNYFQIHPNFIMVDRANALNGNFISLENIEDDISYATVQPRIKLSIPFTRNTPLTTSIVIDFEANDSNVIPTVDLDNSFIQGVNGNIVKFNSVDDKKLFEYNKTGRYQLDLKVPSIPSRADIIISYANTTWADLKEYYMSGYIFEKKKTFELTTNDGSSITTILTKVAWVFVDSISDSSKEEQKANLVMRLTGVDK